MDIILFESFQKNYQEMKKRKQTKQTTTKNRLKRQTTSRVQCKIEVLREVQNSKSEVNHCKMYHGNSMFEKKIWGK